jgi:hypothetical protein
MRRTLKIAILCFMLVLLEFLVAVYRVGTGRAMDYAGKYTVDVYLHRKMQVIGLPIPTGNLITTRSFDL